MSTTPEPNFTPRTVCTLCDWVSVQCEPVWFHVNISRAVCRVPGVIERA